MLRKATKEDSKKLFEWRNDAETRANSVNTDEIKWEDHERWLDRSLANFDRRIFIFEVDDAPAGTCRIDREVEGGEEVYELSWTVAPEWRGRGIGKKMLGELLKEEILKGKKIKAVIKRENIASIKMAEKFGFQFQKWENDLGTWILK